MAVITLRPTSDVETAGWSATPLWSKIEEGSPGDGTTVNSDATQFAAHDFEVALASGVDPLISTGHKVRIRWGRGGSFPQDGRVALFQGANLIAQFDRTFNSAGFVTEEYALSSAQADSIVPSGGNYTDLRLRITGMASGSPGTTLGVDFAEFEYPRTFAHADISGSGVVNAAAGSGSHLTVSGSGALRATGIEDSGSLKVPAGSGLQVEP